MNRPNDTEYRITRCGIAQIDLLMDWRMRVLKEVFAENPFDYDLLYRANKKYYETHIPSGKHIAVFAVKDGEIAACGGLCLYTEIPSPDNPTGKCGYLMNIYTKKEHRGQGAGHRIVGWLKDFALAENAGKIYLETTPAGRFLYEDEGFVPMKDYMKLEKKDEEDCRKDR